MNFLPSQVFDAKGNPIKLGRQLGRGGEGAVFDAPSEPDYVAKIYHAAVPSDKAEKIQGMASHFSTKLLEFAAWPIKAIYKNGNKDGLCGFLMPKVLGYREIHVLYSPAQRKKEFPKASWDFLIRVARNLACAIGTIHEHGHVIGDVNQKNFLVSSQATVKVIDCDSFQVNFSGKVFPCEVGVGHFIPPELQNRPLDRVERFQDHDNFGLALLIFHLLFMGRHPFVGISRSGDMSIEQAISEYRFAYGNQAKNLGLEQPPNTLPLKTVSYPISDLFEQAFGSSHKQKGRPTAKKWVDALETLEKELRSCQQPTHKYHRSISSCPWCELEKSGIYCFLGVVRVQNLNLGLQDMRSVWASIEAIQEAALGPFPNVPFPSAVAAPIPDKVKIGANPGLIRTYLHYIVFYGGCFTGFAFPPIWIIAILAVFLDEPLGLYLLAGPGEFNQEKNRRESMLQSIEKELEEVKREWTRGILQESFFKGAKKDLKEAHNQYSSLNQDLEKEILEARKATALNDFLDQFYLYDEKINNIGTQRKATLASFGIETAADVVRDKILNIPGFGPGLTGDMLVWRQGLEARFHRNPPQTLPDLDQGKATQIQQNYLRKKNELESRLRCGPSQLEKIRSEFNQRRDALLSKVDAIVPRLAQAKADNELIQKEMN